MIIQLFFSSPLSFCLFTVHHCQLLRADVSASSAIKVVFARLCQKRSKRQLNEFQVVIVHSSALDADHREAELSLFFKSSQWQIGWSLRMTESSANQ